MKLTIQYEKAVSYQSAAFRFMNIFFLYGPCTANELINRAGKKSALGNQNIVTRLGELRDMEVVKELGTRKCTVTGMNVIVWDVTNKLPKKIVKNLKKTRKQIRKELLSYLGEMSLILTQSKAWTDPLRELMGKSLGVVQEI